MFPRCVSVELRALSYTYVECEQEDDERQLTSGACRRLIQFAVLEAAACIAKIAITFMSVSSLSTK